MNARDAVLVGGRWLPVPNVSTVVNPATGSVVGTSAAAGPREVDLAVASAATAFTEWGATPAPERVRALTALHDELRTRRDELVACVVAEVGAPVRIAREAHVDQAMDVLTRFIAAIEELAEPEHIGNSAVHSRPIGVVACITPWNYPLYQLVAKVGAALAAGCTVVVKPSELTPLTAYLLADAADAAALPPGVLNLVPGSGADVGTALVGHPGVDMVSFTGSTRVGREIATTAGALLRRTSLELGGKSASIVLDDADLAAAVSATVGSACYNSGQTCSALTRLLVPRDRYEQALHEAANRAADLVVGDPTDEATDLGPLISARHRALVAGYVDRAVDEGARLVAGGSAELTDLPVGHYFRPTVLADVEPSAEIVREEVFGPVLVVLPHDGDDHACQLTNDTRYGLAGAVWSADRRRAVGVATRLRTGQVDINGAPFNPAAPFGGWRDSGIGRELGGHGIREFRELISVQY
jgi:acyl-CoA reductase-like NAD-dependent aldehyde dehydrogenase